MCKQQSLTKYQKQIVKQLEACLGNKIPFTYDKAQNNHLKVLIKDVDKPLYTGSTPSDRKSAKLFMALVKRSINHAGVDFPAATIKEQRVNTHKKNQMQEQEFDKIKTCCMKLLRARKTVLEKQEKDFITSDANLESLVPYRKEIINELVEHALKQRRKMSYFRSHQLKNLNKDLLELLDFAMPSKSDYASMINLPSKKNRSHSIHEMNGLVRGQVFESDTQKNKSKSQETQQHDQLITSKKIQKIDDLIINASNKNEKMPNKKTNYGKKETLKDVAACNESSIASIFTFPQSQRIKLLRQLNSSQLNLLMADITEANELNLQKAINDIKNIVIDFNVPLERLLNALQISE